MKRLLFLASAACILTLSMSCKKESGKKMTVVKDCTGTYLRYDGKDYHVCNDEKLAAFANNATVTASYKNIKSCAAQNDKIICMMFHQNEGWIEISAVR